MFKFRKAIKSDVEFLFKMRKDTMHKHLINVGINLDESEHLDRVLYKFECAKIIIVGGMDVGLLKVSKSQKLWKLIQIQIIPEMQGIGFGRKIIQNLILETKNAGVGLELSVLRENPARMLYESCGFSVVDRNEYELVMRTDT